MHPFTVILGIILGSLVSIAFGLAVVAFIFWLLQADYPRFADEMPLLLRSAGLFIGLSVVAGAGFFAVLQGRRWRYPVLALLWIGLFGAGWYYWPS